MQTRFKPHRSSKALEETSIKTVQTHLQQNFNNQEKELLT